MPYKSVSEAVKKHPNLEKYSEKAQRGWMKSFNSAIEQKPGDEGYAFAVAYSVANKIDGKRFSGEDKMRTRLTRKAKSEKQKKYQEFFDKTLEKYDADTPADMDDETKKKFFKEIDEGWVAEGESGKKKESSKNERVARQLLKLAKKILED